MKRKNVHIATRLRLLLLATFVMLAAVPAIAQNSKGDRPQGNQRQVRETKAKSVKKREKAKTKDIAGRRLRTKDRSSATRANATHAQPDPYSTRPRVRTDRAAKPRVKIYSKRPTERQKAWKGDVSGTPVRRVKPRTAEAARSNVYPQRGPYVSNASKKPKKEKKYFGHTRTATGQPIVRRIPQQKQRAWKGNIKGGAIGSPSATGMHKNVFSQRNEYSRYRGKAKGRKEKPVSNASAIRRAAQLSSHPNKKVLGGGAPASASGLFNIRGRKNVYWGKFSKGERPYTRDLTGRPLRTRNFRSATAGLVGRDSLKHFNQKPSAVGQLRAERKKMASRSAKEQGWQGDVSGWKLRRLQPRKAPEVAGKKVYPRKLSISGTGKKSQPLPGSGFSSRSGKRWNNRGTAIDPKIPPSQAQRSGKFAGNMKGGRPIKGGGSVSGRLWNNKRTPIDPRVPPAGARKAGTFSGNIMGRKGFADQGEGFSGYIKSHRPVKGGGSVSGRLWNNKRTPIDPRVPPAGARKAGTFSGNILGRKGFADQGEGFSGYIKSHRPVKGGGSVSGKLWNNKRTPIDPRVPPASARKAGAFSGNVIGRKGFADQGEGFSGYIKAHRPIKGGGSVSGGLWNNRQTAIDPRTPSARARRAGNFAGNVRGYGRVFGYQGEGFSGYRKASRPVKGGGSVSGKLWNNKEEPIDVIQAGRGTQRASRFQGNIKTGRPVKGGGSVSGKLWNNNEEPIDVIEAGRGTQRASQYRGRKRQSYVQNPNSVKESTLKKKPDPTTYQVAGLQIRAKRGKYEDKPHAAEGALKGISPGRSSVKASQYMRGVKVLWQLKHNPNSADEAGPVRKPGQEWSKGVTHAGRMKLKYSYRHNPNSADDALKVLYLGKAHARIEDFQGNTKMKKYNGRKLHPDADFAHSYRDNVKEERTFMMNVKLLWSKLFKKSETQPDHLKRNERRPRYDKGEKGLWYD